MLDHPGHKIKPERYFCRAGRWRFLLQRGAGVNKALAMVALWHAPAMALVMLLALGANASSYDASAQARTPRQDTA